VRSLGFAVADGAVSEEGGEAAAGCIEEGSFPADIKEACLLTGEARFFAP
jgi:hypothetical protein